MERRTPTILMDRETAEEALARLERVVAGQDDRGPQPLTRTQVKKLRAEAEAMTDDELHVELRGRNRIFRDEQMARVLRAQVKENEEREAENARLDAEFETRLAAAQQRLAALGLDDLFKLTHGSYSTSVRGDRFIYFTIAKPGSHARETGEAITLEILDRLEALAS